MLQGSQSPARRAPRTLFLQTGEIRFRTRLLSFTQAERFGKCLRGNDRFRDVAVNLSEQARSERAYFVTFAPVNRDRVADMVDRQQETRTERAEREGADYRYFLDTDAVRPFYWVLSTSGETYELDSGECSCPDYQFRLKKADWTGIKCKHICEMIRRFGTGELPRLSEVRTGGGF